MLHLYLSLPTSDPTDHRLVSAILELNADIGLVQAAVGDDEVTREVTAAHIATCDGLVAVISGEPDAGQSHDVEQANEMGIPVWLLSDGATVDVVGDRPVRTFSSETFLEFVDRLAGRS